MLIYKCDICGMEEKKGVNEVNTQNQRVFAIIKIGDFEFPSPKTTLRHSIQISFREPSLN